MDDWCFLSVDDTLIEAETLHTSLTQQHLLLDIKQDDKDGVVINPQVIELLPMDDVIITQDEFLSLQNTETNEEKVTSNHCMIKHLVDNIIEDLLVHIIQNKQFINTGTTNGVAVSTPSNINYNLECIGNYKKYRSFIFIVNSLKISYTSSITITSKFKV